RARDPRYMGAVEASIALDTCLPDEDPFASRLSAETPRLKSYAARLMPSTEVDDLVQDTLARAWRYRATFDADKEIGPWLRTTALRLALDARARRGREPSTTSLEEEPEARAPVAGEVQEDV